MRQNYGGNKDEEVILFRSFVHERMIVSLWTDTGNYPLFQILQPTLKRQAKCLNFLVIGGKCPDLNSRNFSISGTELKTIMTENVMDKTKEKANTAYHETRDSYEDVKSAAKNTFKTAGVEGQKVMDEVKKTESKVVSDLKGEVKKAGVKYNEMEAGFHKNMEMVETMITDHPIPAVLVALGVGVLAGMLLRK